MNDNSIVLYGWALWDYPPPQVRQISKNGDDYIAAAMWPQLNYWWL